MAFDLQDNIFICIMKNKLRHIKSEGGESRDIDLPGIQEAYNVVLHTTGEKILILDISKKTCFYKVLKSYSLCSVMMYFLEKKMTYAKVKR